MAEMAEQGTGYVGGLCAKQHKALRELRVCLGEQIQHARYTDPLLLRFLRSKNFDLETTAEALRKHLEFREQLKLDTLQPGEFGSGSASAEFSIAIKKYYPHGYHGTDRQGRPVYIERLGELDPHGLLTIANPEEILEYFSYESERQQIERLPACSLTKGYLVETTMTILDLKGLSFSVVTNSTVLNLIQAISKEAEANFPSVMSIMVIVNAPAIFSLAWKAIQPWLDPRTVERIQIFSAGQFDAAQNRLLELIAPEELPPFLGGSCCKCKGDCLLSNRGPWSDPHIQQTLLQKPHWEIVNSFIEGQGIVGACHDNDPDTDLSSTKSSIFGKPCIDDCEGIVGGINDGSPDADPAPAKSSLLGVCHGDDPDTTSALALSGISGERCDEEFRHEESDSGWHTPRSVQAEDSHEAVQHSVKAEECYVSPGKGAFEAEDSHEAVQHSVKAEECYGSSGKGAVEAEDSHEAVEHSVKAEECHGSSGKGAVEEFPLLDTESPLDPTSDATTCIAKEPEEEPENAHKSHPLFSALVEKDFDSYHWMLRSETSGEASYVDALMEKIEPWMEFSVMERLQPLMEYGDGASWFCTGSRGKPSHSGLQASPQPTSTLQECDPTQ